MKVGNLILQANLEDYITMLPNVGFARRRCNRKESLIQEHKIRAAISAAYSTEELLEQRTAEIFGCF